MLLSPPTPVKGRCIDRRTPLGYPQSSNEQEASDGVSGGDLGRLGQDWPAYRAGGRQTVLRPPRKRLPRHYDPLLRAQLLVVLPGDRQLRRAFQRIRPGPARLGPLGHASTALQHPRVRPGGEGVHGQDGHRPGPSCRVQRQHPDEHPLLHHLAVTGGQAGAGRLHPLDQGRGQEVLAGPVPPGGARAGQALQRVVQGRRDRQRRRVSVAARRRPRDGHRPQRQGLRGPQAVVDGRPEGRPAEVRRQHPTEPDTGTDPAGFRGHRARVRHWGLQKKADAIHGSRLEFIPEAGVLSAFEQPETYTKIVLGFLKAPN